MIIVTGATGQLGRDIVERLLSYVPAERIGASVRDPAKARDLLDRGVRVRQGDFADPAGLAHAFEGASQVLVVSAGTTGEAALALHRAAIDAAVEAGARRVLYTSHMGASPTSLFAPMPDHAATETMLRECGTDWTSLRNGYYASSAIMLLGDAVRTGVLAAPEDGPISWTAHADLAEAAARVLAADDGPVGPTAPLTGGEALDLAAIAELASELSGRKVERVVVTDEEYRANLLGHGGSEWLADLLLGMFAASRQGEFVRVDPALGELIGRPPTPFEDVLRAAVTAAR
ncbi:SDR family oxidoreductase [Actinacidiphila alni]|uniref:SDR family oxidoreductase n=1 Tax=Actinacidiphila alni TaxID=380248 RepID=UPI0033D216A3